MKILTYDARKAAGLTLQELSEKTGIGRTTLNQLELIAIALNAKISALFESNYK